MIKISWVVIICILLVTVGGCGQESGSGDSLRDSGQRADGDSGVEEDPYAIYQRFLKGEEPLYFREDTSFSSVSSDSCYNVEADRPYEFYDICNIINMIFNNAVSVDGLSGNISYAYIDCGADGDVELAVLFHDLEDCIDSEDVTLVIKNVDDRLEICYSIQPDYRKDWKLANAYGWITDDRNAGTGLRVEVRGCILADGAYNEVYSVLCDHNFHLVLDALSIDIEVPDDEVIALERYWIGAGESGKECNLLTREDQHSGDIFSDLDALSGAIAEATGKDFYSYEEIQEFITEREIELGVTDEIKNGPEIQWILLDEEYYNLIYGVEEAGTRGAVRHDTQKYNIDHLIQIGSSC